jgi:hypothetical protein
MLIRIFLLSFFRSSFITAFSQGLYTINPATGCSPLMHSIHFSSGVFPSQALERKRAQETLIECAGLRNVTKLKVLYIHGTPNYCQNYS